MELNNQLLEKAKKAKTSDELILLAKENGFDLREKVADKYIARLNPKSGEIGDDELGDVSGGCETTYVGNGTPVVTAWNTCEYFRKEKGFLNIVANGGYCKDCYCSEYDGFFLLCKAEERKYN